MSKEPEVAAVEQIPSIIEHINLRELGFADREGYYNLGLANSQAERFQTKTPEGDKVTLVLLDTPLTGLGLEYILCGVSPLDPREKQARGGITADWKLPDDARKYIANGEVDHRDVARHERHERLAAYREFDRDFRVELLEALRNTNYDAELQLQAKIELIKPEVFIPATLESFRQLDEHSEQAIRGKLFGFLSQHPKGLEFLNEMQLALNTQNVEPALKQRIQEMIDLVTATANFSAERNKINEATSELLVIDLYLYPGYKTSDKEDHKQFVTFLDAMQALSFSDGVFEDSLMSFIAFNLDWTMVGSTKGYMDPVSNKIWLNVREWYELFGRYKDASILQHMNRDFDTSGLQFLDIDTTQVSPAGRYRDITNRFVPENNTPYVRPLIAFVDTPQGRRFLSKDKAEQYLPDQWKEKRANAMMGRVALAFLEPDITQTFLKEMPLPRRREGEGTEEDTFFAQMKQDMNSAQMVSWISLSGYAKKLLSTPGVDLLAA